MSFIDKHGRHFVVGASGAVLSYVTGVSDNPLRFGIYVAGMDFIIHHYVEEKKKKKS